MGSNSTKWPWLVFVSAELELDGLELDEVAVAGLGPAELERDEPELDEVAVAGLGCSSALRDLPVFGRRSRAALVPSFVPLIGR